MRCSCYKYIFVNRSLYTDDDITEIVEKLDTYFHPVLNSEVEQPMSVNTSSSDTSITDTVSESLHVISENITNTSLDLVKSEVGCINREIYDCVGDGARGNGYTSICDKASCDKNGEGLSRKAEIDSKAGNKLCVCDKSVIECNFASEVDEEKIYKLAGKIVDQVINEARSIVAKESSNNFNDVTNEYDHTKEENSVIKCSDNSCIIEGIIDCEKNSDGQNSGTCSMNSIKSNTSVKNQTQKIKSCRFNTSEIGKASIQALQERVFGVKTLLRPCSKLGEHLLRMLLEQEATDCTIEVQGETFHAHRY